MADQVIYDDSEVHNQFLEGYINCFTDRTIVEIHHPPVYNMIALSVLFVAILIITTLMGTFTAEALKEAEELYITGQLQPSMLQMLATAARQLLGFPGRMLVEVIWLVDAFMNLPGKFVDACLGSKVEVQQTEKDKDKEREEEDGEEKEEGNEKEAEHKQMEDGRNGKQEGMRITLTETQLIRLLRMLRDLDEADKNSLGIDKDLQDDILRELARN